MLAFVVDEMTELSLEKWGPFALLATESFGDPRPDGDALLTTSAAAAVMIGATYALALAREGSVQALLGLHMSRREKVFLVLSFVVALMSVYVVDERRPRPPYDLPDSEPVSGEGITVKVGHASDRRDDPAIDVALELHSGLLRLADDLALDALPSLYVVPRSDLDAGRFVRGRLSEAEGVLVQASLERGVYRAEALLAWASRELLVERSRGRLRLERTRWLLDGYALAWRDAQRDESARRLLRLRALYGAPLPLREEQLRDWLTFREAAGDEIAGAVAWSGLFVLREAAGTLPARAFLRDALARDFPYDARSTWRDWREPMEERLRRHTGLGIAELLERWNAVLSTWREELGREVRALPRLHPESQITGGAGQERLLRYRLDVRPAPPLGARVELLHVEVDRFGAEIAPEKASRESWSAEDAARWQELPTPLVRDGMLAWCFELDVPELGCRVSSGWRRVELR